MVYIYIYIHSWDMLEALGTWGILALGNHRAPTQPFTPLRRKNMYVGKGCQNLHKLGC